MSAHPTPPELAQLRDIHLPKAINWWPLAPGWYLLAFVGLIILGALIFYFTRKYHHDRAKRRALLLLTSYQEQYKKERNSQVSASHVSELLKRVALVYFPRSQVASLQGEAWIAFLNSTGQGLDFNQVRSALLQAPYQRAFKEDLTLLFHLAQQWITKRRGRCLN